MRTIERVEGGLFTDVLGWVSSAVLLATIGTQVRKQWRDRSSKGVSKWLFVGQIAASVGFTTYSLLIHSWVFVVTNGLMAASAVVGLLLVLRHRGQIGQPGDGDAARVRGTPSHSDGDASE